jgi:hypothetical protein
VQEVGHLSLSLRLEIPAHTVDAAWKYGTLVSQLEKHPVHRPTVYLYRGQILIETQTKWGLSLA